jgi:hypothetical protein
MRLEGRVASVAGGGSGFAERIALSPTRGNATEADDGRCT